MRSKKYAAIYEKKVCDPRPRNAVLFRYQNAAQNEAAEAKKSYFCTSRTSIPFKDF